MPAKTGSRNGLAYGWALGENNWNVGMDGNLSFIDRFGLHLSFKSFLNTPPGSPAAGDCYVIAAAPTGAWAGKTGQVAVYDDGAWRYGVPRTGWQAYCEADGEQYVFDGGWSIASGGPDVMAAKSIKGNKNAVSAAAQDLTPSEARTVMELGTAAVADTGTGPSNVILGNDSRLSDTREWSADTVSQADAEAGTSTTRRAWTAQRVRQAIAAWWLTASSALGRTLVNVANAAAGRTALGLGTAATANVTTSSTDTTSGAVMRVGDFGVGNPSLAANVLTDAQIEGVIPGGLWRADGSSTSTEKPTAFFTLLSLPYASSVERQFHIAIGPATPVPRVFVRGTQYSRSFSQLAVDGMVEPMRFADTRHSVITRAVTPTNSDSSATVSASALRNHLLTGTPTEDITYTLPTGTNMDAVFVTLAVNQGMEWSVMNLAADTHTITVAQNTDHTVVGNMVVAANTSGRFLTHKTAANTFITYRIA